jgi:hypothetical protein
MKEPSQLILGLMIAVAAWLSTMVAFIVGIVLAPLSLPLSSLCAVLFLGAQFFYIGLKSGGEKASKSWLPWALAGAGWAVPWIWAGASSSLEGLPQDLGGPLGAIGFLAIVLVALPFGCVWLGVRRAWKHSR